MHELLKFVGRHGVAFTGSSNSLSESVQELDKLNDIEFLPEGGEVSFLDCRKKERERKRENQNNLTEGKIKINPQLKMVAIYFTKLES